MDVSTLCHKVPYEHQRVVEGAVCPMSLTVGYTTCILNDIPNLRRYVVSCGGSSATE